MATSSSYFIIYTTILLLSNLQFSIAANNDTDRLALLHIKAKFNDPLGHLDSWNDSLHFCNWYGVTCGRKHQRVIALNLRSSKLSGSLSPYIGNLSFLTNVQLFKNELGGTLPHEIGRLYWLKNLSISNNFIAGEIPTNISGCSSLITLDVSYNKLIGHIPDVLGSLLNLQILYLSNNNLTGNIPASLGNLSSVSQLGLGVNQLVGNVPNSFGKLTNLTFLDLSFNKLSGLLPPTIFNLSRMQAIGVDDNDFHGMLPSDIGFKLPLLHFFSIVDNSFEGVIPTSVSNLSNLQVLQLSGNNFHGKAPCLKNMVNLKALALGGNSFGNGQTDDEDDLAFVSSLGNATMLSRLDISQNNFIGKFPKIICDFSALYYMNLAENKIRGEIPSCIVNLANLETLSITTNQISGVIPNSIGKLHHLEQLYLDYNQLSGNIPSSIGNLTKLSIVTLSGNNLVGNIPPSIGNCSNLLMMFLPLNNLNGTIPSEILSLSELFELDLSRNNLTGPLKEEVGQLRNIVQLDISGNLLSGEIPASLATCVELQFLNMYTNFFEGSIPDNLNTMLSLQVFDLSYNDLSRKIPNSLVHLPLKILDISYNNFSGQVPVGGIFNNATGLSIDGNNMLCGGNPTLKLHKCHSESHSEIHKKRSILQVIIFGLLGILVLVISTSLCTFWFRKRSKKATTSVTNSSMLSLSYQRILKATNEFSSENIIGSGAFGTVYKGILDSDETLVAIKVIKLELCGAFKSFMAECSVLRNIRHRNLLKVITACSSIDYQGNDFKALVYEYMVNGNLEDWLYSNHAHRVLSLRQRLNIAVDVALAMEYLHIGYGACIVHCDLKPSNILLDQDMVAHVGDFGLAKFLVATSPQAFQSSSLGLRGTVGYAPPEYGLGNEVSTSGDVYSFGILLMEIITGKRPTHEMFKDGLTLHNLVQAALPEKVTEIIDESSFVQDEDEDTTENNRMRMVRKMLEASTSVLGLALCCSADVPEQRLRIKEVGLELSAIRNKFNGTPY